MRLYVDPADMTGLQELTGRAAEDVSAAGAYFDKHAHISWTGEGLINICRDTDDKIERDVRALLRTVGDDVLPGTAAAIGAARDHYLRTDQARAEQIDATMPAADVAGASRDTAPIIPGYSDRSVSLMGDLAEPTAHLTEPPDFNEKMPFMPKWHDLVSPGAMVRDAFYGVTSVASKIGLCDRAYDLLEIALKPICGDWAGMARVGYVLKQTSRCLMDVSANLVWAAQCTQYAWNGNAADAQTVYLYRLKDALNGAAMTMTAMGEEYAAAAQGAYDFSDTIGALIVDAADAAVTAAAAAGVAGLATSTGVGTPVAVIIGVFCLYEVNKVISACRSIVQIISKLDALTSTLKSSGNDFGRIDGDYPLPALPAAPALPR